MAASRSFTVSEKASPAIHSPESPGILNGTCNYILSRMSATGEAMDIVLADAQRLGYAEADPTADVDGFDAAAKLVVLAGIAFHRHLGMPEVPRRSIRPLASV